MDSDQKQKLISLLQTGFDNKDMATIKQAMDLDDALGNPLTKKDFEDIFHDYIKEKIADRWLEQTRNWISNMEDDLGSIANTLYDHYRKKGDPKDLEEISDWLTEEAKAWRIETREIAGKVFRDADDYRSYIKYELEF